MRERNTSLDAVKGFAILLVMMGHVINLNELNAPVLYHMIEAVQMPVFIMLSGYISGLKPPINNVSKWKSTMNKRAVAYLLPFFVWLLLKQWDNLLQGFVNTIIQLDRGLWFLMTLFLLNLILYTAQLLSSVFQNKGKIIGFLGFCGILGVISAIFAVQLILHIQFLSPELTIRYLPPFVAGYFASLYKEELEKFCKEPFQLALFVVSTMFFLYRCIFFDYQSESSGLLMQIVEGIAGSYSILYIFLKSKKNLIKEKLTWLGAYTLEIYTIHFHFADKLNPRGIHYSLYSADGFMLALSSFVLMSCATAGLIYLAKQVPIMNLLLFGKALPKQYYQIK